MKDISSITTDINFFDSDVPRAANILSVQLESLEYAPDFGIDLDYFLSEDFTFQNESFKSYMINVLAESGINVTSILDTIHSLYADYTFNIKSQETSTSLIAR